MTESGIIKPQKIQLAPKLPVFMYLLCYSKNITHSALPIVTATPPQVHAPVHAQSKTDLENGQKARYIEKLHF